MISTYNGMIPSDELSDALSGIGFIGVHTPEQYDLAVEVEKSLPTQKTRRKNFWRNFEEALNEGLYSLEGEIKDQLVVAESVITKSIIEDVKKLVGYDGLKTASGPIVTVNTNYDPEMTEFGVEVLGLFGSNSRVTSSMRDLDYLSRLEVNSATLGFDSMPNLSIERYAGHSIRSVEEVGKTRELVGRQRENTHAYGLGYGILLSSDDLIAVSARHGPNPAR